MSILPAIPQIINFLSHPYWDVPKAVADALSKLSEQGRISKFLIWTTLIYFQLSFESQFSQPFHSSWICLITWIRVFVRRGQIHCWNSQSKVEYQISDLNGIDVLLAEFRESIQPAIPQIVDLLGHPNSGVCKEGANTLLKLSEQGRRSKFLTWMVLMYF